MRNGLSLNFVSEASTLSKATGDEEIDQLQAIGNVVESKVHLFQSNLMNLSNSSNISVWSINGM
jgi:hypothetical protein